MCYDLNEAAMSYRKQKVEIKRYDFLSPLASRPTHIANPTFAISIDSNNKHNAKRQIQFNITTKIKDIIVSLEQLHLI